MAARPNCILDLSIKRPFTVITTPVTRGRVVKFGASDTECLHSAAGEAGFGVALEDGIVGQLITVQYLAGNAVVPVIVGTGGATRGAYAVVVANGVTNAPTIGGGTVLRNIVGWFTQTGVAGDEIGMVPMAMAAVSA